MAVAVRLIKIFGTKDKRFSILDDVIKMNVFFNLCEGGAEILSTEISDPYNSILMLEF